MIRGLVEERLPELGSFWVRYRPRRWPGPETLWLDATEGRIRPPERAASGSVEGPIELLELLPELDDTLWLPPVAGSAAAARDLLVERALELGAPVVVQAGWSSTATLDAGSTEPVRGRERGREAAEPEKAGGRKPESREPSLLALVDPLTLLLDRGLDAAGGRSPEVSWAAGAHVLLPVIPGLTAGRERWQELCALLAAAGAAALYPLPVEIDPPTARRIAERLPSESEYRSLFHGDSPSLRVLARDAFEAGFAPIPRRPLPAGPPRLRRRRFVAGRLATAAELWLALGREPVPAQELFRAARRVDREDVDLDGLRREGNLGVLDWLRGPAGELVEQLLETGGAELLEELMEEYLRN